MVDLPFELDRTSSVPLYHQLAQQLEAAIHAGTIRPGQELGNEIILANRCGVSRPTMRRALTMLVAKGLLVRRRGVGTSVVESPIARSLQLTSLFDDLQQAHQHPRTAVLAHEVIPASEAVAAAMRLPRAHPVLHLLRVRYAADEPLAILENFLPPDLADLGEIDLTTTGLYQALRTAGVPIKVAKQRIGARTGTDEECRMLDEPPSSPVLTMDRITHDNTARVIEFASHRYRASRYQYTLTLVEQG